MEWVRTILDLKAFWGLIVSAAVFVWAHYLRHLVDVEIFVLCLGALAFTTWIFYYGTILYKNWFPKKPKKYINKKFVNENVEIDGCEFYDCFFDNVIFVYRGGIFKFVGMKTPEITSIGAKYLNNSAQGALNLQKMLKDFEQKATALGHKITTQEGYLEDEEKQN